MEKEMKKEDGRNMREESPSHVAGINPDKVWSTVGLRRLVIAYLEVGEHFHENKNVTYFPEEITAEKIGRRRMVFVPVAGLAEKICVPIFLLNLTKEQKKEIKEMAKEKLGIKISPYYFFKPKDYLDKYSRALIEDDFVQGLPDDWYDDEEYNKHIDDILTKKPRKLISLESEDTSFEDVRQKDGSYNRAL